jgi:capsular polysaccharide export protein
MDLVDDPVVAACLGARPAFHSRLLPVQASQIVGWGRKWSGQRASALAAKYNLPLLLLEDGFLRSVGRHDQPVSLVLDRMGVHYDATRPSSLEGLIAQGITPEEAARARRLICLWRQHGLSKYNAEPEYAGPLAERYVLVVDQTFGDASIRHGLADGSSFATMLAAALDENPQCTVVVKLHPDTTARGRKGYFDLAQCRSHPRILVVAEPCHPVRLIAGAEAVYTVTSQVGFEALIWGKRVRTFGMGFYAGWGLTDDHCPAPARRQAVTLEQLVHAALVAYPRYVDPVTMRPCNVERAIDHISLQRRQRLALPRTINAIGFSRWKRPFVRGFLSGAKVSFTKRPRHPASAKAAQAVAVWGSASVAELSDRTLVLRMEDGFLRSSGLGADLVRPLSLVIDDVGIYYDATRPSRLEQILNDQHLDAGQSDRARRLRQKIVDLGVTKYNLGQGVWSAPAAGGRTILVVGQVETDASIRLGSPDISSNLALLRRVRAEQPHAHVLYKPHPDVLAGLRGPGRGEEMALQFCDEILGAAISPDQLFSQIDELHTMTSLMGFEALLRGVRVVCHGLPFYAGWGLTEDRLVCARRLRRLTIEDLVHGALIAYPRYINADRACFMEPEEAVDRLAVWSRSGPTTRNWQRRLLRAGLQGWMKLKGQR